MIDFNERVLLLTGANGGISRAIATMFFNQGAHCFLTDIDEQGVIDFAQSLDPSGSRCVGMKQDVTQSRDADRVMEAVSSKFGHLDYLDGCRALSRSDDPQHDRCSMAGLLGDQS